MKILHILLLMLLIQIYSPLLAKQVALWDVFELELSYKKSSNPFVDISLSATFSLDSIHVKVNGFYDGNGVFKIRFMPSIPGDWSYETSSNVSRLNGAKGTFTCVEAEPDVHGTVCVKDTFYFKYADGHSYFPIGTTAYVWHLQNDSLCQLTLKSLKNSPFNKIRMCVFPKLYEWTQNEPQNYPYVKKDNGEWDFEQFNPVYFQGLEKKIKILGDMGIEADLILFHPYDYSWGFDEMDSISDIRYLNYVVSRLASFRNVWWSMGNEYDLIQSKDDERWDAYFRFIKENDPYGHLLSVHNGPRWYDHSKPWISHLSLQLKELNDLPETRKKYRKPVIVDECGYEGTIPWEWGNMTGKELVHRFWLGISRGCYVAAHGETFLNENDILWWSKGGTFKGESVERIRFLKKIIESFPKADLEPVPKGYWSKRGGCHVGEDLFLFYTGSKQPAYIEIELPSHSNYSVEVVDTWKMVRSGYPEKVSGKCRINLPGSTNLAVICRRIKNGEL